MARTVIIGDVHGCSAELSELVRVLHLGGSDRIFFVGDLVGRGPDARGVLAIVRELGAVALQGNHERRLLEVHGSDGVGRRARLGPAHRRLFYALTDADWAWMRMMPLYVELPEHDAVIVHAGIDHRKPMSSQDPWVLTHLRSFDESGEPSHRDGNASWAASYPGPTHVVFGHNAVRGLQLHPHATGLDTGCVYGGRLSALVIEPGEPVPAIERRPESIVSVAAKQIYFDPHR